MDSYGKRMEKSLVVMLCMFVFFCGGLGLGERSGIAQRISKSQTKENKKEREAIERPSLSSSVLIFFLFIFELKFHSL